MRGRVCDEELSVKGAKCAWIGAWDKKQIKQLRKGNTQGRELSDIVLHCPSIRSKSWALDRLQREEAGLPPEGRSVYLKL